MMVRIGEKAIKNQRPTRGENGIDKNKKEDIFKNKLR